MHQRERLLSIDSRRFRLWLTQRFWEHTSRVVSRRNVRDVQVLLEALALDGKESNILIRWIGNDDQGEGDQEENMLIDDF